MYSHSDYVRASNLHGLGMIKLFEGDMASTEQYLLRSLDLTESAFNNSKEKMSYPHWADNARECAMLAVELHGLFVFFAIIKDDKDSEAKHMQRLKELAAWADANPR